jgi:hypothetical protein
LLASFDCHHHTDVIFPSDRCVACAAAVYL